jgi:hypothetical protein
MRIVTMSLAALSLLTLMPAAPAAADSSSANLGIVDFCKVDVPTNHPDMHVGNCVSFQSTNFRDNLDGLVPHLCSYIETVHPDVFDSSYDSYDACVRDRASAFL